MNVIDTELKDIQILAIPSVSVQKSFFKKIYSYDEALEKGTIFPELYLPFCEERG